jgi:hypothetical protein
MCAEAVVPWYMDPPCSVGAISDHGLKHSLAPDPVNLDILVWVGGRLVPREMAGVSPFDSAVQVRKARYGKPAIHRSQVIPCSSNRFYLCSPASACEAETWMASPWRASINQVPTKCLWFVRLLCTHRVGMQFGKG